MTEQLYFEDFQVGQRFKSASRTLTDSHFVLFSAITGDNHPIHYDDEYCKQTIFGKRVAHGFLVTSMTALGASTLSPLVEESMLAFLEQSSRFLKPVLVGDTVRPEMEVAELIPRGRNGVVRFRTTLRNQRDEVVMEGSQAMLLKRRPD